jgi:hypothetical protein
MNVLDQSNCPLGWEFSNDQCIRLFHTPLNYAQAESECAHEAAELVNIVKSSQIDKFLIHDLEQQFEVSLSFNVDLCCYRIECNI